MHLLGHCAVRALYTPDRVDQLKCVEAGNPAGIMRVRDVTGQCQVLQLYHHLCRAQQPHRAAGGIDQRSTLPVGQSDCSIA